MRITDVGFIGLVAPLQTPLAMSFGGTSERRAGLVVVETDEGLQGVGETWVNFPAWAVRERALTVAEGIRPLLMGENPLDVARLFDKMVHALAGFGRQWGAMGPVLQSISGAEMALWDIAGKVAGLPVWRLLGGSAIPGVPTYASGLGPAGVEEMASRCAEQGFQAVKLKVGFHFEQDLANLRTLRRVMGPKASIMVDANQAWSLEQAVAFGRAARDQEVFWLEEPVPSGDYQSMREVCRQTGIPVAAGENAYGREQLRALLQEETVDFLQPDVTKTGGLAEARLGCQMALAWGKGFAPHYFGGAIGLAATLHLFAATPGGAWVELDVTPNPLRDDLLRVPLVVQDGLLPVPAGPGWGIELDPVQVQRFRVN